MELIRLRRLLIDRVARGRPAPTDEVLVRPGMVNFVCPARAVPPVPEHLQVFLSDGRVVAAYCTLDEFEAAFRGWGTGDDD